MSNTENRLTPIRPVGRNKRGNLLWEYRCDCGEIVVKVRVIVNSGHTRSCGCLQREKASKTGKANKTHGGTHTREYEIWHSIQLRCHNPNSPGYADYGAKGISVCEKWRESFQCFLSDMGLKPTSNHQIDRINGKGNYEPGNCRWVTVKEQQRNRKSNVIIEYNGEKKCIAEWAELYGMTTLQVWARIRKRGWLIHDALTVPIARTTREKKMYARKYAHKTDQCGKLD